MNRTNEFNEMFTKIELTKINREKFRPDEIRLTRAKRDLPFSRFVTSKELTDSLPWIENDKLDLYQASKNLFAIVPAKAGLLTLKTNKNTFQIYSTDLCTTLKSITQATSFSGWVDDDKLFFRTNK